MFLKNRGRLAWLAVVNFPSRRKAGRDYYCRRRNHRNYTTSTSRLALSLSPSCKLLYTKYSLFLPPISS